ncbi:unnamed protein product [Sphagnum balticum]
MSSHTCNSTSSWIALLEFELIQVESVIFKIAISKEHIRRRDGHLHERTGQTLVRVRRAAESSSRSGCSVHRNWLGKRAIASDGEVRLIMKCRYAGVMLVSGRLGENSRIT